MSATLTVQTVSRAGLDLNANAVAATGGGDSWLNTGSQMLYINNGSGSICTVTLVFGVGGVVDGLTPTARTVGVPIGHAAIIGPFPPTAYNDANGLANVHYSGVSSVTVAAFQPGS